MTKARSGFLSAYCSMAHQQVGQGINHLTIKAGDDVLDDITTDYGPRQGRREWRAWDGPIEDRGFGQIYTVAGMVRLQNFGSSALFETSVAEGSVSANENAGPTDLGKINGDDTIKLQLIALFGPFS